MVHRGQCRWIWLHVGGESLLDPQFVRRVNLLHDTGAFTAVSTNVTPLTEKLVRKILHSKLGRLILCVDGATKKTYESIRVGANFDDVMAKVDMVLETALDMDRKEEEHPHVWLQCLRMDDTKDELRDFAQKYGEGRIIKYQPLKGMKNCKLFFKKHESYAGQVETRGYGWDGANTRGASGRGRRYVCRKPHKRLTILSDGSATICCYDIRAKCIVGTLEENSINGIWKSPALTDVRWGFDEAQQQHREGGPVDDEFFPELCREC